VCRSSWTADEVSDAGGQHTVFATIADRPRGTDGYIPPPWWGPFPLWLASGFRAAGAFGWRGPAPFRAGDTGLNSASPCHGDPDTWIPPDPPVVLGASHWQKSGSDITRRSAPVS